MQSGVRASDEEVIETNVVGASHLLDAVHKESGASFIQTGSFLEYGMKNEPMREEDRCEPSELYGITKLASTLLAQAAGRNMKHPTLTFRVFTPYGPDMQKGRLVEQIITRALRGEEILLTEPGITRDFIRVSDLVELFLQGMEKTAAYSGQVFNAGNGKAVTLKNLVDTVLSITGSRSPVRWHAKPTVLYDTAFCQASMEKAHSHFAWRPVYDLEAGLRATIDWYRFHPLSP